VCLAQAEYDFKQRQDRAIFDGLVAENLVDRDVWDNRFENSNQDFEKENQLEWNESVGYSERCAQRRNLFIWGDRGVGKTFMSHCILNRFISMGYWVAAVSGKTLIENDKDFKKASLAFKRRTVRVLLIDDIDKIPRNEAGLTTLWDILNERTYRNRRTILTSNMSKPDLYKHLVENVQDQRALVTSALDRLNPCQEIHMTGPSFREKFNA